MSTDMYQRGFFDRLFNLCLGFFVAAGLLYLGVKLLVAILPWLIASILLGGIGAAAFALLRWRRERW